MAIFALTGLVLGICLPGCTTQQRGEVPTIGGNPSKAKIEADWDHLDSAVEVGVGQVECWFVRVEVAQEGLERRYTLKHVSGKTGTLIARGEGQRDPRSITLSCTMGPLGDAELEGRIVRRVYHRLQDLQEKGFAPIRE